MRTLILCLLLAAIAGTAQADVFADAWIRGASSVAVNDDATALFVNPAGLGMYVDSNAWGSVSTAGDALAGFSMAAKAGAVGAGWNREYLWETCECDGSTSLGDDAIDTYSVGFAIAAERKFAVGFSYRWIQATFGDEEKAETADIGLMYRPTDYLSFGCAIRNLGEPEFAPSSSEPSRATTDGAIPATFVAGLAVRPIGDRLTLMADVSAEEDAEADEATYTAGLEAEIVDGLVVRASVQSIPDGGDREEEFSVGLWASGTYAGGGASYRTSGETDDVVSYGLTTSYERMRSLVKRPDGVAEIDIEGPLVDADPGWSLFGGPSNSAQRFMRDIRTASSDESIGALLIRLEPMGGTFLGGPSALTQEIRDEIARAREEHGVKVVAFLEYGAGLQEYYLATAADWIVVYPMGAVEGLGNYVNVMRYTGTSEKIGIEWDYISAGKYKSTFHSLGAGPLTDEQGAAVQSMVDDNYEEILAAIMKGRDLSRQHAEAVCQGGVLTAPEALEARLVDELGHYEDAKAAALKLAEREVPDDREDISTVDVSGWRYKKYDWTRGPRIAVIGAYGGIDTGKGGHDPIRGGQSIGSETLVAELRRVRRDDSVKAVVLRVDSGGGDAIASDIIWRETVKLAEKKPFIVSMADVAGSGGYYIAIAGEKIFVDPLTITGSIGVVGMKPVLGPLYEKIGTTHETFKRGDYADLFSPTRHITDEEFEMVQGVIDWFYDEFLEKVAEGRSMPVATVRRIAEGRVYTGNQALEVGLADELGGLHAAIDYACERVGVPREDAEIVYYREGWSLIDKIMGEVTTKLGLYRFFDLGGAGVEDLAQFRMTDGLPD